MVTVSEDFLAMDGDVVRRLYVEDGDVEAQDARAEKIAAWKREANETLARLEPHVERGAGKRTLAEFTAAYKKFKASATTAVALSRPGDGRRRRAARGRRGRRAVLGVGRAGLRLSRFRVTA